jgi:hypothetical protein
MISPCGFHVTMTRIFIELSTLLRFGIVDGRVVDRDLQAVREYPKQALE